MDNNYIRVICLCCFAVHTVITICYIVVPMDAYTWAGASAMMFALCYSIHIRVFLLFLYFYFVYNAGVQRMIPSKDAKSVYSCY